MYGKCGADSKLWLAHTDHQMHGRRNKSPTSDLNVTEAWHSTTFTHIRTKSRIGMQAHQKKRRL